jgi:membrane-associated phospholipid phosphatase
MSLKLHHQLRRTHPRLEVLSQFVLILGAALLYFLVRGLTQGGVERANANAAAILRLEADLGLRWEERAQDLILRDDVLTTLANWVYIWGHWPVIAVTLFLLHHFRSEHYLLLRNAMFVSGAIGIVIYVSFPVAPPRLLDPVFRDTVTELSTSYRWLQPPALVNKYAAMPSLHAGWNLLAGIAIVRASRHAWLKVFGVVSPAAMSIAVVATGNHYVLDVVVGMIVAVTGLIVADQLRSLYRPDEVDAGSSAIGQRAANVGDQRKVVDDQSGHALPDQFERTIQSGDVPHDDRRGPPQEALDDLVGREPFVDHDAVGPRPGPDHANRRQLPAAADRSHRANPTNPPRAKRPPTPCRHG